MPNLKESKYSAIIKNTLVERGALVNINTASIYDRVGRSDVEAIYKGVFLALELKTGNYKATDLQIMYLNQVREHGGVGLELKDADGIKEINLVLDMIDNGTIKDYKQPQLRELTNGGIIYD